MCVTRGAIGIITHTYPDTYICDCLAPAGDCTIDAWQGIGATHMHKHDHRLEAALYWSAVSLIVCEGLPIDKAAEQLGVAGPELREILHRRQTLRPYDDQRRTHRAAAVVVPFVRH